jgi:hypothetical protein
MACELIETESGALGESEEYRGGDQGSIGRRKGDPQKGRGENRHRPSPEDQSVYQEKERYRPSRPDQIAPGLLQRQRTHASER